MSNLAERPDELNRLLTVSEAIESLSAIFAAEEPLDDVLLRIAHTAASAVPGADAVSITAFTDSGACTVAYTDELVLPLHRDQYTWGRGPCLEGGELQKTVHITTSDKEAEPT